MSYSHSSSRCLRKIKTATESHEYNVSDKRIREACLQSNFDVEKAVEKLLKEETVKKKLIAYLSDNFDNIPSENIIDNYCYILKYDEKKCFSHFTKVTKEMNEQ